MSRPGSWDDDTARPVSNPGGRSPAGGVLDRPVPVRTWPGPAARRFARPGSARRLARGAVRPGRLAAWHGQGHLRHGLVGDGMGLRPADTTGVCATIAWRTEDTALALEANIRSAGRTITWLADLLGMDVEELSPSPAAATEATASLVPRSRAQRAVVGRRSRRCSPGSLSEPGAATSPARHWSRSPSRSTT